MTHLLVNRDWYYITIICCGCQICICEKDDYRARDVFLSDAIDDHSQLKSRSHELPLGYLEDA